MNLMNGIVTLVIVLMTILIQPISGQAIQKAPELEPGHDGAIEINGPPGVEIFIDNTSKGLMPQSGTLSIPGVRGGTRLVQVIREGHPNESLLAQIFENKTEVVNISSESLYGSLEVTANPANVIAYLDTSYFGVTPISSDKVLVGGHKISIHQEGFHDWSQDVMIKSDEKTSVSAELEKLEPTPIPTKPGLPGFTAILALSALLVIGILVRRKKY